MPAKPKDRLVEAFLDAMEFERNASPRTLVNYRHAIETFKERPGKPTWRDCTADHFRRHLFECL